MTTQSAGHSCSLHKTVQLLDDRLIFSPSDIVNHLACEHLTQLNLLVARGELDTQDDNRSEPELIRDLGDTRCTLDQEVGSR